MSNRCSGSLVEPTLTFTEISSPFLVIYLHRWVRYRCDCILSQPASSCATTRRITQTGRTCGMPMFGNAIVTCDYSWKCDIASKFRDCGQEKRRQPLFMGANTSMHATRQEIERYLHVEILYTNLSPAAVELTNLFSRSPWSGEDNYRNLRIATLTNLRNALDTGTYYTLASTRLNRWLDRSSRPFVNWARTPLPSACARLLITRKSSSGFRPHYRHFTILLRTVPCCRTSHRISRICASCVYILRMHIFSLVIECCLYLAQSQFIQAFCGFKHRSPSPPCTLFATTGTSKRNNTNQPLINNCSIFTVSNFFRNTAVILVYSLENGAHMSILFTPAGGHVLSLLAGFLLKRCKLRKRTQKNSALGLVGPLGAIISMKQRLLWNRGFFVKSNWDFYCSKRSRQNRKEVVSTCLLLRLLVILFFFRRTVFQVWNDNQFKHILLYFWNILQSYNTRKRGWCGGFVVARCMSTKMLDKISFQKLPDPTVVGTCSAAILFWKFNTLYIWHFDPSFFQRMKITFFPGDLTVGRWPIQQL